MKRGKQGKYHSANGDGEGGSEDGTDAQEDQAPSKARDGTPRCAYQWKRDEHQRPACALQVLHCAAQHPAHPVAHACAGDIHQQTEDEEQSVPIVPAQTIAEHLYEDGCRREKTEQQAKEREGPLCSQRPAHQLSGFLFRAVTKQAAEVRLLRVDCQQPVQPCVKVVALNGSL